MIFNSERNKIEKLTYDNPNCRNIFSFLFPFSPFSDSKLDWNLFEKVREGIRKKKSWCPNPNPTAFRRHLILGD